MTRVGLAAISLLLLLISQTGCAPVIIGGAAAGAGTYAYFQGNLKSKELASLERTWFAVVRTVEEIDAEVVSREKDSISAKLVVKDIFDKKVRIYLRYERKDMTDLTIRHGILGDEQESKLLLRKIQAKLY